MESESFGSSCQYRYEGADYIGKGTYGIVYKAQITDSGDFGGEQIVAVKVVHLHRRADSASNPVLADWNKRRARLNTLLTLRHENLVLYHKVTIFNAPGGEYVELMMDFYRDGDLASSIKKVKENGKPLEYRLALRYMIEIACGLEYLHKNNIIHGDLKPENVLVKKTEHNRDTLQIGDLDDLVEMQRSVTCSVDVTHLRGTTQYMSPEMVKKFAGVSNEIPGRKTDIWSLGCIMLELANCAMNLQDVWIQKDGQAVEVSNTRMPTTRFLTMVIDGGVPFLDISLPLDLASCIQYCLCTNVEERISADELVLYLSAARYHGRRLDQTSSVDITSGKHVIFFHMIADPGRCCWHRCSNVPLVHRNLVFVQLFNVSANTISKGLLPDDIHGEFLYPFIAIGKQGTICQTIDVHQDDSSVNTFVWNIASQTSRPLYISDSSLLFYRPIMVGNMIYFWDQRATFAEFKKANTLDGSVESIAGPEITVRVNRILCGAIVDHQLIYIALVSGGFNKDSTRMYCYDTITGEWRCIQGLVNDRVGFELVALHGKLYLLGELLLVSDKSVIVP